MFDVHLLYLKGFHKFLLKGLLETFGVAGK